MLNLTNNAYGELLGNIGASTGIMTIKDGKGGLFPSSYPYELTIEQLNSSGVVEKREIVEVTNKTGDTFNINRAVRACPINDTSISQTQTPQSFSDGSIISLRLTSQIGDAINNLDNIKLNKSTYYAEQEVFSASATGNDAYKITSSLIITYNNGQTFKIQADVGNDGACTLELNSLGAKFIKKYVSGALQNLETGDISAGQIFWATYNFLSDCFQFSVDPATSTTQIIEATKSQFIAGETLTKGYATCISGSNVITADINNSSKTTVIGFAYDNYNVSNNALINTSGVTYIQNPIQTEFDQQISVFSGTNTTTTGFGQTFTLSKRSKINSFVLELRGVVTNMKFSIYTSVGGTLLYDSSLFTFDSPSVFVSGVFNFTNAILNAGSYYIVTTSGCEYFRDTTSVYSGGQLYQGGVAQTGDLTFQLNYTEYQDDLFVGSDLFLGPNGLTQTKENNFKLGNWLGNNLMRINYNNAYYQGILTASNAIKAISQASVSNNTITYTKVKEIKMPSLSAGTIRVVFSLRIEKDSTRTAYGRIYKNGVAVGTERTTTSYNFIQFTEDITVVGGDLIQLFIRSDLGGTASYSRDFYVGYNKTPLDTGSTVII